MKDSSTKLVLPLMRTHVIADTVKQKQATHLECVDGTTKGASWETLSPEGLLGPDACFCTGVSQRLDHGQIKAVILNKL